MLLPFSGCLPIFFFICAILGGSTGALDTGTYDFIDVNISLQQTNLVNDKFVDCK